jgi:hypothetical protein
VNPLGRFFLHRKEKQTTGKRAPTIDLGGDYVGPIPPAYGHTEWIKDKSGVYREVVHRERFVDEIVAWEFLGPPPKDIRGMHVLHKDGDRSNPAAANLLWVEDDEYFETMKFYSLRRAMQHSLVPPARRTMRGGLTPTRCARPLIFVDGKEVPLHKPTELQKAG